MEDAGQLAGASDDRSGIRARQQLSKRRAVLPTHHPGPALKIARLNLGSVPARGRSQSRPRDWPGAAPGATQWSAYFRRARLPRRRAYAFGEGGAGDPSAPPGDAPGGMAAMSGCAKAVPFRSMPLPVPSGGSPDGTGGSPVLPNARLRATTPDTHQT